MVLRLSKARKNFEESSNRTFTYDRFSYKVVRIFFDQLHHVTSNEVSLPDALELMVFCNYEGQIDQKSEFETQLYKDLRHQILAKIKDSRQLCFIWMFLRSWGPSGRDSTLRMVKLCLTFAFYLKKPAIVLTKHLLNQ